MPITFFTLILKHFWLSSSNFPISQTHHQMKLCAYSTKRALYFLANTNNRETVVLTDVEHFPPKWPWDVCTQHSNHADHCNGNVYSDNQPTNQPNMKNSAFHCEALATEHTRKVNPILYRLLKGNTQMFTHEDFRSNWKKQELQSLACYVYVLYPKHFLIIIIIDSVC